MEGHLLAFAPLSMAALSCHACQARSRPSHWCRLRRRIAPSRRQAKSLQGLCRYINNRQKETLLEWMREKNIAFPKDLNTMPRKKPEEVNESELKNL